MVRATAGGARLSGAVSESVEIGKALGHLAALGHYHPTYLS